MRAFIKKQSKTKKIIALMLAVVLALVPLVSHLGPRSGARAAGEEYTFALGEIGLTCDEETGEVKLSEDADAEKAYTVPASILGEEGFDYAFSANLFDKEESLAAQEITVSEPEFYLCGEGEFAVDAEGNVTGAEKIGKKTKLTAGSKIKLVFMTTKGEDKTVLAPVTVTIGEAEALAAPVWKDGDGNDSEADGVYGPETVQLAGANYAGIGTVKYAYGEKAEVTTEDEIDTWSESTKVRPSENMEGWYGYAGVFVDNKLVDIACTENKVKIDATAPEALTYELADASAAGVKIVGSTIYFPKEAAAPALSFVVTDSLNADGSLEADGISGTVTKGTISEDKKSVSYLFTPDEIAEDTKVTFVGRDAAGNAGEALTLTYSPVNRDLHFVGTPVIKAPVTDGGYTKETAELTFTLESGYQFEKYSIVGKKSGGFAAYDSGNVTIGNGEPIENGNYQTTVTAIIPAAVQDETTFAVKDLTITATDAKMSATAKVDANYVFDTTKPVVSNVKLQKKSGASWVDVKASEVTEDGDYFVFDPEPDMFRYYFDVKDPAGNVSAELIKASYDGNAVTAQKISGTAFACVVAPGVDDPDPFKVRAVDLAGNTSDVAVGNYRVITVDSTLRIAKGSTIVSPEGATFDDLTSGAVTGVPYVFKIIATSAYDVTMIKITGENGLEFVPEKIEDKTESNKSYEISHRKVFTGTVTIPEAELKKNQALRSLKIEVRDDHDQTAERVLGDLLYDQTRPVITTADGKELSADKKWYKTDYELGVNITAGDLADPEESDIAWAKYSISNSVEDKEQDLEVSGRTVSATVKVPESTSVEGTMIAFDAADLAGNHLDEPKTAIIRVDKTKPRVTDMTLDGHAVTKDVTYKGKVTVSVTASDNLTLSALKLFSVSADGTEKALVTKKLASEKGAYEDLVQEDILYNIDTKQLKDGKWTVKAVAVDAAGNESPAGRLSFTVDNTKPVVALKVVKGSHGGKHPVRQSDGTMRDYFYRTNVTIRLSLRDANIDLNNVLVSDNGTPVKVKWSKKADAYYEATVIVKAEDVHYFSIDATDNSGNDAKGDTLEFMIDKIVPEVDNLTIGGYTPDMLIYAIKGDVKLTAELKDNYSLGDVEVVMTDPSGNSYSVYKENLNLEAYDLSDTLTVDLMTKKRNKSLYDGKWTAKLIVKDLAGNKLTTDSYTFTVDNTVPVVTAKVVSGVGGGKRPLKNFDGSSYDYYNRSDVGVELTCKDDNLKSAEVKDNDSVLDAVTWNKREDGTYVANIMVSGDGVHKITVKGFDYSGNESDPVMIEFVRDTVLPVVSANIGGGSVYSESMGTVDVTGTANVITSVTDMTVDPEDLNFRAVVKKPNMGETVSAAKTQANRTFTFSEEADYSLELYAVDMAGNQGPTRNVSFRVDNTAPELTITGTEKSAEPIEVTCSMQESFWWDMRNVDISITRTLGEGGSVPTASLSPQGSSASTAVKLTDTGRYEVRVTATDRAGHTAEASKTFIIDADAPKLTLKASYTDKDKKSVLLENYEAAKNDSSVNFYASVDEIFFDNQKVTLKGWVEDIDGNREDLSFDGFTANGKQLTEYTEDFKKDGIYHIELAAEDEAGNKSEDEINFTIDTEKPIIGDLSKYMGNADGYVTGFTWDEDLDKLVKDLTVCDTHVYLNGKEYDGNTELSDGFYKLQVVSVDELGHEAKSDEIAFTLDSVGPEFIVTGVEKNQIKNESYNITVSLQLDEDTLTKVSLNGQDIPVVENSSMITVTEKGDYKLTMSATDKAGHISEEEIDFTYGTKLPLWPFIAGGAGALILILLLIFLLKRKKSE